MRPFLPCIPHVIGTTSGFERPLMMAGARSPGRMSPTRRILSDEVWHRLAIQVFTFSSAPYLPHIVVVPHLLEIARAGTQYSNTRNKSPSIIRTSSIGICVPSTIIIARFTSSSSRKPTSRNAHSLSTFSRIWTSRYARWNRSNGNWLSKKPS